SQQIPGVLKRDLRPHESFRPVFSLNFCRASAKARLLWRSFSRSFTFSLKLRNANSLRLSLLIQEPGFRTSSVARVHHYPLLCMATSTCSTAPNPANLPWNSSTRSPKMLRTIALSISFAFLFALALPSAAQTTFTETGFTTDTGISWATIGDFDRDGLPDIAVAEENSTDVAIFKNSGNNTFTRIDTQVIADPFRVETADFNKDGNLDLAVVSGGPSMITILTGLGNGAMSPAA